MRIDTFPLEPRLEHHRVPSVPKGRNGPFLIPELLEGEGGFDLPLGYALAGLIVTDCGTHACSCGGEYLLRQHCTASTRCAHAGMLTLPAALLLLCYSL